MSEKDREQLERIMRPLQSEPVQAEPEQRTAQRERLQRYPLVLTGLTERDVKACLSLWPDARVSSNGLYTTLDRLEAVIDLLDWDTASVRISRGVWFASGVRYPRRAD